MIWMAWPKQIEYDLMHYEKRSVGEWLRGEMSSREFLVLVEGLINTFPDSWLRFVVQRDAEQARREEEERIEAEVKAVNKAEMHGAPLRMSDLGEDYLSHVTEQVANGTYGQQDS